MWLIPTDIALIEIKTKFLNMLISLQVTTDPVSVNINVSLCKIRFSKQKVTNGIILKFGTLYLA